MTEIYSDASDINVGKIEFGAQYSERIINSMHLCMKTVYKNQFRAMN